MMRVGIGVIILGGSTGVGCLPHVDEQTTRMPHEGVAVTIKQTRPAKPALFASVEEDVVTVRVLEQTQCQWLAQTPTTEDVVVRRELRNGTLAQGVNLTTAVGLGALGIWALASPLSSCSVTPEPTADNQMPMARACTSSERDDQSKTKKGLGALALTGGAVAGGLFIWNIVRAADETKQFPAKPLVRESGWKVCQSKPIANAVILLELGGASRQQNTNAGGEAVFRLRQLGRFENEPSSAMIKLLQPIATSRSVDVSLSDSPMLAEWRQAVKLASDTELVDHVGRNLVGIENILGDLETKPEPWGDAELETSKRMVALFNEMQQIVTVLRSRQPIDLVLAQRLASWAPRVDRFSARVIALMPRAKRAADARDAALVAALLGAGSAGSGFSVPNGPSPNVDARIREMDERHQREREEDRRQAGEQRKRDEDQRQREREEDEQRRKNERHQQLVRCNDQCEQDYTTCANRCTAATPTGCGTCQPAKQDCWRRCDASWGR